MEGAQVADSFMSEAVCSYLGLVGLLGEYCPTSKKRNKQLCPCAIGDWLYASKADSKFELVSGSQVDAPFFQLTWRGAKTS